MILRVQLPRMYAVLYSPSEFWDSLFQDFGKVLSGNKTSWLPVAMWLLVSFSHFWVLVHYLLLFPPSYNVGLSWTLWSVPAYDCGVFPYQYLLNIYFLWHYFCDWLSCMLQDQDWCFTIHVREMTTVSSLGNMWSYSILPNQNFHQSGSNPLISMIDFH